MLQTVLLHWHICAKVETLSSSYLDGVFVIYIWLSVVFLAKENAILDVKRFNEQSRVLL